MEIVLTSTSYLAGIVINSIFFVYLCRKFSIRYLNLISILVMFLGALIRMLMNYAFWTCILGQFMEGLGACIIMNLQISVSFQWTSKKYRGISLALISIAALFGKCYLFGVINGYCLGCQSLIKSDILE